MSYPRYFALALLWIAGIATIIGSSLEEERPPPPPPVPVTVQFDLGTPSGLERKLETRTDDISGVDFFGSYSANQDETLTLDRNTLALDVSSSFTLDIDPDTGSDELLMGRSDIIITELLDAGLTGNPDTGQFTSNFDGTTTTVTANTSEVDVLVEGGSGAETFSWSDFEAAETDETLSLDIRMASAAYNNLVAVLVLARIAEDLIDAIDDNKTMLESMNLNSRLALTCDNNDSDASHELSWTLDPPGTGQGEVGPGDEFEAEYTNCETDSLNVFLDGRVPLEDYDPDDSSSLETRGIVADFNTLYLSDTAIIGSLTPSSDTPRFRGELSIRLQENAISRR